MSHSRFQTLLLFSPPLFGAILGGATVHLVRVYGYGASAVRPDVRISLGMAVLSVAVLALILARAAVVRRGARTRFPRLFRVAPISAFVGLLLGVVGAIAAQLL